MGERIETLDRFVKEIFMFLYYLFEKTENLFINDYKKCFYCDIPLGKIKGEDIKDGR